jgi:hypothetical protein
VKCHDHVQVAAGDTRDHLPLRPRTTRSRELDSAEGDQSPAA